MRIEKDQIWWERDTYHIVSHATKDTVVAYPFSGEQEPQNLRETFIDQNRLFATHEHDLDRFLKDCVMVLDEYGNVPPIKRTTTDLKLDTLYGVD